MSFAKHCFTEHEDERDARIAELEAALAEKTKRLDVVESMLRDIHAACGNAIVAAREVSK